MGMQFVDDVLWGHTDGGYKQLGARINDDLDQLVELSLCVVVAVSLVSMCMFIMEVK